MASSNPTLNENIYDRYTETEPYIPMGNSPVGAGIQPRTMTIEGTLNKTLVLFALLVASAGFTWSAILSGNAAPWLFPLVLGSIVGSLIIGLVTSFRPQSAPITAPIYAVLEGLALGAISALFNRAYHGIVGQAVVLTLGVLGIMLMIYRTGLIRVTPKLYAGVFAATGAIGLVYLVNILMRAFGNNQLANFLWSSSPLSIGISLVVVGVAAFNLLLDFDFIEKGAERRAPLFMEWYAGYGLMVTVVWLYLELLRLLAKLNRR